MTSRGDGFADTTGDGKAASTWAQSFSQTLEALAHDLGNIVERLTETARNLKRAPWHRSGRASPIGSR